MATTIVHVLMQIRDQFGADVLSGGKIYTYEAGTTTPLATYQDLAGATAHTNPIILDSSGMVTNDIRQTDGVAYKWVVYDADDNELWTRDNITVGIDPSAAGSEYLVHLSYKGTLDAQGWMGGHIFDDAVTFPIDLEGAQASVKSNPGSAYVVSIKLNGAEVATLTIDTDGTETFATTGGVAVTVAAGDQLDFYGPDTVGTAADFVITLAGAIA